MGRSFYLFPRKNGVFYAEILSSKGVRLFSRSTGKRNRDEAAGVAALWVKEGVPPRRRSGAPVSIVAAASSRDVLEQVKAASLTPDDAEALVKNLQGRGLVSGAFFKPGAGDALFLDFIRGAWNGESDFLQEKAKYGHAVSKRHVVESLGIVERYWNRPAFAALRLVQLDRATIKKHLLGLIDEGLSPQTANKAFAAVSAPVNWAHREGRIPFNPCEGVPRFTQAGRRRDILTEAEVQALTACAWPDERGRVAFLTSLTTGLRLGELLALQGQDLGPDRIYVRHSWSYADRLTTTKNKETRTVPAFPAVLGGLRALGARDPHGMGPEAFIFAGREAHQPLDGQIIVRAFYDALEGIGINAADRKARNLVFHSLRHAYATAMTARLSEAVAAKGTGHKSFDVLRHYSDHETAENIRQLAAAAEDAFGNIIKFRKEA